MSVLESATILMQHTIHTHVLNKDFVFQIKGTAHEPTNYGVHFAEIIIRKIIETSTDIRRLAQDTGCGCGIIPVVAATFDPHIIFYCCDTNPDAIESTEINIITHNLMDNITVDDHMRKIRFFSKRLSKEIDIAIFNPPQRLVKVNQPQHGKLNGSGLLVRYLKESLLKLHPGAEVYVPTNELADQRPVNAVISKFSHTECLNEFEHDVHDIVNPELFFYKRKMIQGLVTFSKNSEGHYVTPAKILRLTV